MKDKTQNLQKEKLSALLSRLLAMPCITVWICFIALCLVYLIPNEKIAKNVNSFVKIFQAENLYPVVDGMVEDEYFLLDNYTDAIMVLTARYNDDLPLVERVLASKSSRIYIADIRQEGEALIESVENQNYNLPTTPYIRYWHGYLVLLKPLLYFFDYPTIRNINFAVQIILLIAVVILLYVRRAWGLIPIYIFYYAFLFPPALQKCLSYATVYIITSVAVIYLLLKNRNITKPTEFIPFFTVVGIVTNFADFLTYPLVSLVVPLAVLLYLTGENAPKKYLQSIVILCGAWGFGYIGMWCIKWGLAALVFGKDVFDDVIRQITLRSGQYVEQKYCRCSGVNINFYFCLQQSVIRYLLELYFISYVISAAFILIKNRKNSLRILVSALPFLLLALSAPLWFYVMTNHSVQHYFFTFRTCAAAFIPLLVCLAFMCKTAAKNK